MEISADTYRRLTTPYRVWVSCHISGKSIAKLVPHRITVNVGGKVVVIRYFIGIPIFENKKKRFAGDEQRNLVFRWLWKPSLNTTAEYSCKE
jgi:hypothetical protein